MKNLLTFLSAVMLTAVFACQPNLEPQIKQLHEQSLAVGSEVAPKVEALAQQKNSINIQGRALTQEEILFTKDADSAEATFVNWNKEMKQAEAMPANQERLTLEQALYDAILVFQKQVETLVPKPGF
ncbi:MAG: hypothetical protein HY842_03150 [Bacteroidetes bacterium]|nr:hypothetical protein [Bacteroidota bacterium]